MSAEGAIHSTNRQGGEKEESLSQVHVVVRREVDIEQTNARRRKTCLKRYSLPLGLIVCMLFFSVQHYDNILVFSKSPSPTADKAALYMEWLKLEQQSKHLDLGNLNLTKTRVPNNGFVKTFKLTTLPPVSTTSKLPIRKAVKPLTTTICVTGKPYGYQNENNPGWCNFILAVSHALRFGRTVGGKVLLHTPHSKRWSKLYGIHTEDMDVEYVRTFSRCTHKITYKEAFYKFDFKTFTEIPHFQDSIKQKAIAAITKYKKSAPGRKLVSVHRRWFIEQGRSHCVERHQKCPQFCTGCKAGGHANRHPGYYNFACTYTEETVRDRFKTVIPANAIIILMTDGQNKDLDKRFKHIDTNSFFVQLEMMAMTDIHIESPASSIGKIVGTWRHTRKLPTYPNECYAY